MKNLTDDDSGCHEHNDFENTEDSSSEEGSFWFDSMFIEESQLKGDNCPPEGGDSNDASSDTDRKDTNDNDDLEEIRIHKITGDRHIRITEKKAGGSIETMIWPAAQYLAEFVLDYAKLELARNTESLNTKGLTSIAAVDLVSNSEEIDITNANERVNIKNTASNTKSDQSQNNISNKSSYLLKEKLHKAAALEAFSRLFLEFDLFAIPDAEKQIHVLVKDVDVRSKNAKSTQSKQTNKILQIIELGAGVGLTGIMLASELRCRVLLTDIDEALPFLHKNKTLNEENFIASLDAVTVKALHWGTEQWRSCLFTDNTNERLMSKYSVNKSKIANVSDEDNVVTDCEKDNTNITDLRRTEKVLLLASDCVYFKELHAPFEQTIASILSAAPSGSMCLVACARRWKRDTAFFSRIGKLTQTKTHHLECVCVQETINRNINDCNNNGMFEEDNKREIMRVYAIQWLPRTLGVNIAMASV